MPTPSPINCQCLRSFVLPFIRRGNHATGTAIVRPSVKSTERVSSVTCTDWAWAVRISSIEILLPTCHESFVVGFENPNNPPDFLTAESSVALEPRRRQPELCYVCIPLNVNVRWLLAIGGEKEKPERPKA